MGAGLAIGQVIAGKYRIERFLGEGGMGTVYAARHLHLHELVAIKSLRAEVMVRPEIALRFQREAIAAARIKSEHIARVHDFGKLDDGRPFMVMELLEGEDLARLLARTGPMSTGLALQLVLEAADGLMEAHRLGIVHRDLKPSNLFCIRRADGRLSIKIVDFGIAKLPESEQLSLTTTGSILGSPLYASPEQLRSSSRVDHRTDIWSLAVVLYELLTGTVPFAGTTLSDLSIRIAADPPRALGDFRPDIPAALEAIIFKAIEKKAEDRYASIAEFAKVLNDFARIHGVSLTAPGTAQSHDANPAHQWTSVVAPDATAPPRESPPATNGNWVQTAGRGRPTRARLALISFGLAAPLLGLAIFAGFRMGGGHDEAVSASGVNAATGSASSDGPVASTWVGRGSRPTPDHAQNPAVITRERSGPRPGLEASPNLPAPQAAASSLTGSASPSAASPLPTSVHAAAPGASVDLALPTSTTAHLPLSTSPSPTSALPDAPSLADSQPTDHTTGASKPQGPAKPKTNRPTLSSEEKRRKAYSARE